jgi:hypothetical protein
MGASSQLQGILVVKKVVLFVTGSCLNGRVMAQTACDLQMDHGTPTVATTTTTTTTAVNNL